MMAEAGRREKAFTRGWRKKGKRSWGRGGRRGDYIGFRALGGLMGESSAAPRAAASGLAAAAAKMPQ
jgi:hypothetical protein